MISESTWAILITQVVLIALAVIKNNRDKTARIQDREDWKAGFHDTKAKSAEDLAAAVHRANVIIDQVQKSREETKAFAAVANNVNGKIEALGVQILAETKIKSET